MAVFLVECRHKSKDNRKDRTNRRSFFLAIESIIQRIPLSERNARTSWQLAKARQRRSTKPRNGTAAQLRNSHGSGDKPLSVGWEARANYRGNRVDLSSDVSKNLDSHSPGNRRIFSVNANTKFATVDRRSIDSVVKFSLWLEFG